MSPFSPAQPRRAETRLSQCIALASFQTLNLPPVCFGPSLTAALPDGQLTTLQAIRLSFSMCSPLSFHCSVMFPPHLRTDILHPRYLALAGTGLPSGTGFFDSEGRSATTAAKLTTTKKTTVIPVIHQAE